MDKEETYGNLLKGMKESKGLSNLRHGIWLLRSLRHFDDLDYYVKD